MKLNEDQFWGIVGAILIIAIITILIYAPQIDSFGGVVR